MDRLKATIYRDFLNFITSLSRYTLTVLDFRESLLGGSILATLSVLSVKQNGTFYDSS